MRYHPDVISVEETDTPFVPLVVRMNVAPDNPNVIVQGPFFGSVEIKNACRLVIISSMGTSRFANFVKLPMLSSTVGVTARGSVLRSGCTVILALMTSMTVSRFCVFAFMTPGMPPR